MASQASPIVEGTPEVFKKKVEKKKSSRKQSPVTDKSGKSPQDTPAIVTGDSKADVTN